MEGVRDLEAIYAEAAPVKSGPRYDKEWDEFIEFVGVGEEEPAEKHFAGFFDHLFHQRGMKGSTIWARYSRLNNCYR